MAKTDNGGPAFPLPRNHSNGDAIFALGDGMSLRDYFAAKALPSCVTEYMQSGGAWDDYDDLAKSVWSIADAMLRERAK